MGDEQTEGAEPVASQHPDGHGFFKAGIEAVDKIAKITKTHGVRYTSTGTGIVILLALVGEFLSTGDYVPHHGEIIGLVSGVLLIIGPLIANSIEYKWELEARTREIELTTEQLRIEADFEIARLGKTNLGKIQSKEGEGEKSPRPKARD